MGPEVVPLFSNNREQNQINPRAKDSPRLPGNRTTWPRHSLTSALTFRIRSINILWQGRSRDVYTLLLHQLSLLVRVEPRKQIKHLTRVRYTQKSKLVRQNLVRTKGCRIRRRLRQR